MVAGLSKIKPFSQNRMQQNGNKRERKKSPIVNFQFRFLSLLDVLNRANNQGWKITWIVTRDKKEPGCECVRHFFPTATPTVKKKKKKQLQLKSFFIHFYSKERNYSFFQALLPLTTIIHFFTLSLCLVRDLPTGLRDIWPNDKPLDDKMSCILEW